jgi:hypothetical protein
VDDGAPGAGGDCMTTGMGACGVGKLACNGGALMCIAMTMPVIEACDTPADENCDGLGPCDGKHLWSRSAGDQLPQGGSAVASDSAGNVVVAGHFEGIIDLGGGPVQSVEAADAFVEKLDPEGKPIWIRRCGGALNQFINGVAIDSKMNVIAAGAFEGTLSCAADIGVQSAGSYDVFAAKLDAVGTPIWIKRFGDIGDQRAAAAAVGGAGDVLLAGSFTSVLDFGVAPLQSAGGQDVYVAKLDAAGSAVWSRGFGSPGPQYAMSIASDAAGNAVVAGCFQGSLDFGEGAHVSAGSDDIFVAKLDPAGAVLWSRRFGGVEYECGNGIALDSAGSTTVLGHFSGTVDFGTGPLQSAGSQDLFVIKLDPQGNTTWSGRFGGGMAYGLGVALDGAGNTLLTGQFIGALDFGAGTLMDTGNADVFVAKLDPSGKGLWSKRYGSTGVAESAVGTAIAADPLGYVLVTGRFNGQMDVDGMKLSSAGSDDFFVSKLAP